MAVPSIDLVAEYNELGVEIDAAIKRVIESGTFVMGEELAAFEKEFAAYCGARYAVGAGSGTAAIMLALAACGIGPGDEVITVPNTDLPTTSCISQCGAGLVWVDVDRQTFNIDPEQLEAAISERTRAIMPVHLYGHPAEMDGILEIAERYNLLVIEDAALAVGAEYRGAKVGTLGQVGCYSFAPTKILGAYGDAGAVVTDDRQIADRIRELRNYGHSLEMGDIGKGGLVKWKLIAEGYNERLDTLQAAILRAKLPTLDSRIERRRKAAQTYDTLLAGLDVVTPYQAENVRHVYRTYPILVKGRDQVRDHLRSRGIAAQVYYIPLLHQQPVYEHLGFERGSFPISEALADETLCLPIYPEITGEQIEEVVAALKDALDRGLAAE